jgi:hypothetical protein
MRARANEATKERRLLYLLSARGAILLPAWGSVPGYRISPKQALKARILQLLHLIKVNRAFSARAYPPVNPGALPQAQH